MKPRGLITALLLCASVAAGQEAYSAQKSDFAIEKNGGLALPSGYLTIKEEAGALTQRDILSFVGTSVTCADTAGETVCTFSSSGAPTDADYLVGTANAGLSAEVVAGAGVMTFLATPTSANLISAVTNETGTGALVFGTSPTLVTPALGTPSALVLTNATGLPVAGGGTGAATFTIHGVLLGQTTAAIAATSAGVSGQPLVSNGASADPTFQYSAGGIDPATQSVVFEDLYCKTPTTAATNFSCGSVYIQPSGTASASLVLTLASDGNHPGVVQCSTGTTTTGTCAIGTFGDSSTADYIQLSGGEFFETMVYIGTASDGTNTHRLTAGFQDKINVSTVPVDDAMIYWDNNADTHWGCETSSNNSRTATLSTTVATAAAWHKLRIDVNAAATSVAYQVDGVTLSCSPMTLTIPTGAARGVGAATKITAAAGCAANTTCVMHVDYLKFADFLTR